MRLSVQLVVGAAVVAASVLSTMPRLSGQSAGAPALVITAYNGGAAIPYTLPRTPWGEPDLQGVWSSDDTEGIPRERPEGSRDHALSDRPGVRRQAEARQGGAARRENDVSGTFRNDYATRAFRQTSLIVDPPDGSMPAFTPEALKRRASRDRGTFGEGPFNTFEDFTLYDRCITRGVVGSVLRVIYGNGNRIVQGPGMVAFSVEMIHDTRVFYTDGRPHISPAIRQYLGDARARWEGDELVVVTTNFTDKTSIGGNGNGLRHSDRMVITERFKRVAEDVLQYQFTVDDPVTYDAAVHDVHAADPAFGRRDPAYECHEGNGAVKNALSAERAEDAALAADLAKGITRARRPVQEGFGGGGRAAGAAPAGAAAPAGRGAAAAAEEN